MIGFLKRYLLWIESKGQSHIVHDGKTQYGPYSQRWMAEQKILDIWEKRGMARK